MHSPAWGRASRPPNTPGEMLVVSPSHQVWNSSMGGAGRAWNDHLRGAGMVTAVGWGMLGSCACWHSAPGHEDLGQQGFGAWSWL